MKNQKLIESLQHCISVCNYCAASCLEEDNVQSLTNCVALDLNCADVCTLALKKLTRDAEKNIIRIIKICLDTCLECAEECEKHDHDHCRECAKACHRCADHCRNYLNQ